MSSNPVIAAVTTELRHYPGVEHEIHEGGKHKRMVFHRGGVSRFLTVPRSASDWRASQNALRDFKKTMNELGAQRLDILPGQTKGRRARGHFGLSLNHQNLILHIPGNSKLIDRFKTPDNRPRAHWTFELRASPDLSAPPMLAVKQVELPPGKDRMRGAVGGFHIKAGGGWRLSLSRDQLPALSKRVDIIKSVNVELYEDNGSELVFKLPTGVIPTKFKAPQHPIAALEHTPLPSEAFVPKPDSAAWIERAEAKLAELEAKAPEPAPASALPQNLTLQFPKQPVSVEQAIMVLNKAKARLGNNLRFTIAENGYLTAVHRIGQ